MSDFFEMKDELHPVMAKIIIYSRPGCGYCDMSKAVLREKGIAFTEKVIGRDVSMGEFFQEIGEEVRTVPQIMVDKRLIGGYNELMKYLNNNDENPRYSLNGSDI